MKTYSASLGIDLGTSNSALALAAPSAATRQLPIAQSAGPGATEELLLLPSAIYLPAPSEHAPGAFALPWSSGSDAPVIGAYARSRGALAPDRLVRSAKSWLCNSRVDRTAPLLPWESEAVAPADRLSPLAASRSCLHHLRAAALHHLGGPETLADTRVVLTVPASFDEAARTLTRRAALEAGWGEEPILLEEPLAALYAWLDRTGAEWRKIVKPGDLILVCDVGGGTADFSLVAAGEREGQLALDRVAVGEHLLLGGDNLDLALAHVLRAQLEDAGKTIDEWQFLALGQAARQAKETLFNDLTLPEVPVAVPTRGGRLFANTVATSLARTTLEAVALEGFLPFTRPDEQPAARSSGGLREFGLNYAADPALSRHLARFLLRSRAAAAAHPDLATRHATSGTGPLIPTHILFNGGVFKAAPMRQRVLDLLASWSAGTRPIELSGADYDLAVARGAAAYGRLLDTGKGVRVRAGTARSYYIGLESTAPAVPGFKPPVKALCVAPQGREEGSPPLASEREFGLLTGEKVEFRLFSSTARPDDAPGALVTNAERELEESARLEATLPADEGPADGDLLPVQIVSRVNELGVLELCLRHAATSREWRLEFQVRTE